MGDFANQVECSLVLVSGELRCQKAGRNLGDEVAVEERTLHDAHFATRPVELALL